MVLESLYMAMRRRNPSKGLIVHSDRGSQYASKEFRKELKAFGIEQSMSRKGDCWDNACAESIFSTIKRELVNQRPVRKTPGLTCTSTSKCFITVKEGTDQTDMGT
jgi:transposase InsO family protein